MTTLNQGLRTFNQREATKAALQNEQVTRERVARVEVARMGDLARIEFLEASQRSIEDLFNRGLWGRFHWLLMGK